MLTNKKGNTDKRFFLNIQTFFFVQNKQILIHYQNEFYKSLYVLNIYREYLGISLVFKATFFKQKLGKKIVFSFHKLYCKRGGRPIHEVEL